MRTRRRFQPYLPSALPHGRISTRAGAIILLLTVVIGTFVGLFIRQNMEAKALSYKSFQLNNQNNVLIYFPHPKNNLALHYDGGQGYDLLWLKLTREEFAHPKFRADMIRYTFFLINHVNPHDSKKNVATFEFKTFPLKITNFENIVVQKSTDGKPSRLKVHHIPSTAKPIYNSSQFSLI